MLSAYLKRMLRDLEGDHMKAKKEYLKEAQKTGFFLRRNGIIDVGSGASSSAVCKQKEIDLCARYGAKDTGDYEIIECEIIVPGELRGADKPTEWPKPPCICTYHDIIDIDCPRHTPALESRADLPSRNPNLTPAHIGNYPLPPSTLVPDDKIPQSETNSRLEAIEALMIELVRLNHNQLEFTKALLTHPQIEPFIIMPRELKRKP